MNDLNPDILTLDGYEPQSHWEDVQADGSGVEKVDNVGCGVAFNKWIYKRKLSVLRRALDAAGVELNGADFFEAGFGGGFYLPVWVEMGARRVNGIDLSFPALSRVREQYPTGNWLHGDVVDPIGVEVNSDSLHVWTSSSTLLTMPGGNKRSSILQNWLLTDGGSFSQIRR